MKWPRLRFLSYVTVMALLMSVLLAVSANAQAPSPSPPPAAVTSEQALAISAHNPFEEFIKVPIQSTTGFDLGAHHNVGDTINVQPLFPFALNSHWDLFARPSLNVSYAAESA